MKISKFFGNPIQKWKKMNHYFEERLEKLFGDDSNGYEEKS